MLRRSAIRLAIGLVACGVAALCAGVSYSAFFSTTANTGNAFTAQRIFPKDRTMSAHDLRDASSGAESNKSNPFAFVDAITYTSAGNLASGSNTYLKFDLNTPRPATLAVTGAQLNITLASNGGGGSGNACAWAQVVSGGSVIGTHGSYASAIGCSTGTTQTTLPATALSEVTSTDQANGLTIRLYAWETGGKKVKIDAVTVTATDYASFTLYPNVVTDNSSGPTVTTWSLTSVDAVTYTATNNWPSATPTTTKYLKHTYDPSVPTGSAMQTVTFTNVWKPSAAVTNGGTLCYYFETYNGVTLLGTHGGNTQATAQSCNATTTNQTDTVTLTEVDTPAKANALVIKLYYWIAPLCGGGGNPGCVKSVTDQAQVTFNYSLN